MNIINKVILAISFLLSPVALANGGVYSSDIFKMILNPAHSQNQAILSASVKVDADYGQIILSLQPQQAPCPAGMYCPAMIPFPFQIILPIVQAERDNCGNVIYVAQLEGNGQWQQITVSDNVQNSCPTFMEIYPTEVYYRSINGNQDVTSQFSGKALSPEVNIAPINADIY